MTTHTDKSGQIIPARRPGGDIAAMLARMGPAIRQALPRHLDPDRIGRIALTALRRNAALAACDPSSFLGAVLSAAQLGLEVNTPLGHAYLVPYKSECTLVVGYQGMLELARRSGEIRAIYAHAVRDGDHFGWELGLEPRLEHRPSDDPGRHKRDITHVYAVARLKDGEPIFTVLSRAEVESYRDRSRARSSGPWVTDYEAMALKTAVRRLFRWLPRSAEMARADALGHAEDATASQAEALSPEVAHALTASGIAPADITDDGEVITASPNADNA